MPRILGIDHGTSRIGLAISDEMELVATPLRTLDAQQDPLHAIAQIVREKHIARIVIGHPLHLSGRAGEAAARVERFTEQLSKVLEHRLPLIPVDERLSSVEAEAALSRSGITDRAARREVVDQLAAVVILQDYLNSQRGPEGFLLPDETTEMPWLDPDSPAAPHRRRTRRGH
ncbi:MAG: Holliday junction resolvase RuvX [Verrucomicrobiales bacterium]|nr:Holliday junction resolvase RuvX [Verrucomicrobiales bacterium]